jgi:hypothetical protein
MIVWLAHCCLVNETETVTSRCLVHSALLPLLLLLPRSPRRVLCLCAPVPVNRTFALPGLPRPPFFSLGVSGFGLRRGWDGNDVARIGAGLRVGHCLAECSGAFDLRGAGVTGSYGHQVPTDQMSM